MVHELIGIRNGRVDLSGVPDIKPELKVILPQSSRKKHFVRRHVRWKRQKQKLTPVTVAIVIQHVIGNCTVE